MLFTIQEMQELFLSDTTVSAGELNQFFDQMHVPPDTAWRALFRSLFEGAVNADIPELDRQTLKPVILRALQIIDTENYSEESVFALIREFNGVYTGLSEKRLKKTVLEIASLTNEFKSTCLRHQKGLEKLEKKTLEAISSDDDPETMINRIKQDFRTLIRAFRSDIVRLDTMSHTDYLTGLRNRRFFDKQLMAEADEALKENAALNLIMIDIDDFKKFNDTYGHVIGDQALKAVALKIRTISEAYSEKLGITFYPARYGGEEFCVIFPEIDLTIANEAATAIRDTIADYSFVIRNSRGVVSDKNIRLTVSIGLAPFNHTMGNSGVEQLVTDADQAMYAAKKAGKNCVRIVTP